MIFVMFQWMVDRKLPIKSIVLNGAGSWKRQRGAVSDQEEEECLSEMAVIYSGEVGPFRYSIV